MVDTCVFFFTLGSVATFGGVGFCGLLISGSDGIFSAVLKIFANVKSAFFISSPDSKSGVTCDGGLVKIFTISDAACQRWSSKETFGKGMLFGK